MTSEGFCVGYCDVHSSYMVCMGSSSWLTCRKILCIFDSSFGSRDHFLYNDFYVDHGTGFTGTFDPFWSGKIVAFLGFFVCRYS